MAKSDDRSRAPDKELSKRDRPKRKPRRPPQAGHRQALPEQIEDPNEYGVRTYGRRQPKKRNRQEDQEEEFVPGELSHKILREARAQQEEVDAEAAGLGPTDRRSAAGLHQAAVVADMDSDSDDASDDEAFNESGEWEEEHEEVSPEDERAMAAFMAPGAEPYQQRTLADIILEKIRQKQAGGGGGGAVTFAEDADEDGSDPLPEGLDPKVVEVYQGVGVLLSRYTTGKLPKAFKIIPNLRNWEEILYLTDLEHWSPHAVYQATRLFVSNLNAKMAQRFLATVLLPHVRQDIRENRRLHFALFQSLKKAAYKPDAFFKGLLLPLCQAGNCTLREAVILTSVIKRVSLPVLHSAAALLRIAEMEYSGTNSWFIRILLDKKYALPYRVVDALVDHFTRFAHDERELPTVWHQALLTFIQRYKHEIRAEDKDALKRLMKTQQHYQITSEVHRELDASRNRGEKAADAPAVQGAQKGGATGENPRALPPVVLMEED